VHQNLDQAQQARNDFQVAESGVLAPAVGAGGSSKVGNAAVLAAPVPPAVSWREDPPAPAPGAPPEGN